MAIKMTERLVYLLVIAILIGIMANEFNFFTQHYEYLLSMLKGCKGI